MRYLHTHNTKAGNLHTKVGKTKKKKLGNQHNRGMSVQRHAKTITKNNDKNTTTTNGRKNYYMYLSQRERYIQRALSQTTNKQKQHTQKPTKQYV